MWNEPDPDPGGKPLEGTPSPREITDLKEQNEQQLLMIAQLKEMLRKEHTTVSQEKVDEYINMLSKVKTKKPRIKREESGGTERGSGIDSIKKEKLNLLKQQLEENKAKLAERGKSQKGIEEMVSQLKAQLNDSQQLVAPISTFEPINLEYSKNSSPEELYNILLIKERKITELTNKNQKQEVNILDLQENLKEKDSVIDARTKAITLMTGSLSKKGKDTLDALDDTKEQMRTMQENFVKLESEMKARQKALLNDLKTKNLEINELQELNRQLTEEKSENRKYSKDSEKQEESYLETVVKEFQEKLSTSHKEIEQHVERISQLEKQLTDSNIELERLKNTGVSLAPKESDAEIMRLKKQLEESNKNSIKLKAQSKSKIKDLTKKLEAFKKMTDANALIVQLQNENTKLSEKIAELEEEKGNNQLKMVESTDSSKDSNLLEEYKTLEEELLKNKMELEEKDKIISLLEIDIVSLREEINNLTEKMSTFSHLENMQITSEMNSIQIEEEMDKLKEENSLLQNRIKDLTDEKGDLNEKIEHLLKEKDELNTKLDNYIQENMDLIDKLEKLSAEKVSSVESIEIVEGLTQQEKLELAAYQKNMEEPLKCSQDEENLEPPPELNESVMQLTEDSAELLRKIEMFNAERKEVMGKMEELKEENNRLAMKVNEIENNRDILAETYEQLQTEKEELQEKKEELLMKLSRIEEGLDRPEDVVSLEEGTSEALQKLQHDYEKLLAENVELKQNLKKLDSVVQEKYNLEVELNGAKTKIELLDSVLKDNMEEITNYQMIIDENKNELINSSNIINSLQGTLNEKENDIKELNELINDLNRIVSSLQAENEKLGNFELMERQVDELKTALNKQIEEAEDYSEELERSNETIGSLTSQLDQMKNKISETEAEIEMKYIELQKLETQLIDKDETIKNLQSQLSEKEHKINSVIEEMKQKYLVLQKNLDGNNDSMHKRVEELTTKNKEQLEKMKKIAANLKKKTQALQDLEEKYKAENEKWETELNEKESVITQKSNQIAELTSALEETEQVKVDLQNMLLEARHKQEKMNEVSLKQELSTSLHEEFDNTVHVDKNSANEDKLKELELIIETNEAELGHYKERVQHLDECVMKLTEEKEMLNRQGSELEQQLGEMTKNVEEKMLMESQLTDKLAKVQSSIEILNKQLEEVTEENRDLSKKHKEQEELVTKLKIKLKKSHEKVTQLKTLQSNVEELEKNNESLKKQIEELEANQRHNQEGHEASQKQNVLELEKIEADYQAQMAQLLDAKNSLTMECEKLNENLKELREKEVEITSELNEYKQKMEEIEADDACQIQKLSDELKSATDNWKVAINQIETLSQQLEDVQKQLILQSAQETVDDVLGNAVESIYQMNSIGIQTEVFEEPKREAISINPTLAEHFTSLPESVPTFQWPGDVQKTADYIFEEVPAPESVNWSEGAQSSVDQQPTASKMGITDELAAKVSALEIMLNNIDKGKHEILRECTGMVNELTRLVYEKVKKAENDGGEPPLPLDIESQILAPEDIVDSTNNKKLQEIEFAKCDPDMGHQNQPVFEEVIQPKQAYVTYLPVADEPFGENDDGWGWGPEEARLEEEHIQKAESTPLIQSLKAEVAQLNASLQTLQTERDSYLEEVKQLQVKMAKLVKKCKELKVKNDQLMAGQKSTKKAEGSDFFDLDATIQEELKSQITQLEKRLKELGTELEKEKLDKSNVLKRCDVLASANDRMVEMKEIQDSEVLRWKRKYEDVEEKLQKQVWNSDRLSESQKPTREATESTEDIEELKNTIKELSIDNEELQALLNEQRQLRMDAEKAKAIGKSEQHEETFAILENKLSEKCKELEAVVSEKQQSIHKLNMVIEEKQKFLEELTDKNQQLEILLSELQKNHSDNQAEYKIQMENIISEKDSSINELKDSLNETNDIKENLTERLENLCTTLRDLQAKYQELETLNSNLQMELDRERQSNSETQILQLQEQIEHQKASFTKQEEDYIKQIEEKQNELHDQMNKHVELQKQLEAQKQNFEEAMAVQQNQKQHQSTIVELQEELSKQQSLNFELQTELQVQKESLEEAILLQQNQKQHESTILQLQQELSRQQNLNGELKQSYVTKVEDLEKELAFYSQLGASHQTNDALLNEKESELKQLKVVLDDLNNQKLVLEEDLRRAKENLEENQNQYAVLESQIEEKMANTVQELELKWQEQVDERGNTVAESWKYHLTMVETEFAEIREKLRTEIDELEAKCNVLVNENNELRKNVDTEIRNEVDRVSAMQQQINERQHTIQELQKENEALRALESQLIEKDNTITSLKLIVDTTQQQFEEKREVVEEIVKILEKNAPWPLPCEKESVITEFQRQLEVASEKDQEITRLNARIVELQLQFNSSQEKEADIFRLQQQVATLQEREVEIDRLRSVESELQKTLFDLETREEQEILSLNAIIEDYKVQADENKQQLIKLKEEKTTMTQTIEDCRKHQNELTIAFEALQSSVLEKDQEILRLKQHVLEMEEMKNDNNKDVEQLHEQINQHKQDLSIVQQALADCQIQLSVVTQEMAQKTNALEVVTQQLESSTKNSEKIEQDLHTLQALLNSKEQDHETMMQSHFKDLENYYQEALSAREIDIQTIRSQLNEALATIDHYSGQLNKEINVKSELELVIKELEQKLSEQSTLLDEEQKQLTEMRSIIEDQVVKIEELKKELFQKSNDYDSLIAEMDIEQKAITQQPKSIEHQTSTSFTSQKVQEQIRIQPEDDMSEPVSRAELDIALYMLHQRDVRCEELMVELTQLLEERDTLQLRLSNAIREKEEIRRRLTGGVQELTASNSSQEPTTPQSKSSAIFLAASGTELAMEPTEIPVNELNLASKLSELKSVGYKKDKTFVDEQEIRRFQQMSIMQQHIQEASKLPPEAAAKLVDASYTLSRDVQSPSKVLLNWLWGRSTPKVNDT